MAFNMRPRRLEALAERTPRADVQTLAQHCALGAADLSRLLDRHGVEPVAGNLFELGDVLAHWPLYRSCPDLEGCPFPPEPTPVDLEPVTLADVRGLESSRLDPALVERVRARHRRRLEG